MKLVMAIYLLCLDHCKNFIFWSNDYFSSLPSISSRCFMEGFQINRQLDRIMYSRTYKRKIVKAVAFNCHMSKEKPQITFCANKCMYQAG